MARPGPACGRARATLGRPGANAVGIAPVAANFLRHRSRGKAFGISAEPTAEGCVAAGANPLHKHRHLAPGRDVGAVGGSIERTAREQPHRDASEIGDVARCQAAGVTVPPVRVEGAANDGGAVVAQIAHVGCRHRCRLDTQRLQLGGGGTRNSLGAAAFRSPCDEHAHARLGFVLLRLDRPTVFGSSLSRPAWRSSLSVTFMQHNAPANLGAL